VTNNAAEGIYFSRRLATTEMLYEPLKNLQLDILKLRAIGFSEVSFISEWATFLCYFLFLPEKESREVKIRNYILKRRFVY
jgi:hypothetical protein